MSAPVDWIAHSRTFYEASPWVSWALQCRVLLRAGLSTLPEAVAAVVVSTPLDDAELERRLASIAAQSETGRRFSRLVRAARLADRKRAA